MNISIYRNSEKVLDKDVKITCKDKEHLLMITFITGTISPNIYKIFFKLVAAYPILINELPRIISMSSEKALEYIGYLQYLILNGLL